MANFEMQGMAELRAKLKDVPDKWLKNALKRGLRQASNIVKNEAKANFGSGDGPNSLSGALRASIRVTPRRGTPTKVVFNVVAGNLTKAQTKKFGAMSAFYAQMVERGHINRKKGQALRGSRSGKRAMRATSTANTPPHPFMRPAIESKGQAAVDAVVETIRNSLNELK